MAQTGSGRRFASAAPEGILTFADETIAIIDCKTAKFAPVQDELMPVYVVQLNGYAAIAEHLGLGHASKLALVYAEPVTDEETAMCDINRRADGLAMPFAVPVHSGELDLRTLPPLYRRARELADLPEAPKGRPGCKDCERLDRLMSLAREL